MSSYDLTQAIRRSVDIPFGLPVFMAMMKLGHMWMIVHQRHMSMQVCMRFLSETGIMFMLVMAPVHMSMVMCDLLMKVEVVMMFPQEDNDSNAHN